MLFGHPKGLYVLFMTEMWERFSYYGMRALLILYMMDHFKFDDEGAIAIYGSFTALIFILPVFGGWLADKVLGFRKAVVFGAILMSLGHFGMLFEGSPAIEQITEAGVMEVSRDETSLQILYLSLSLLICGVGFLKPNITSIVGLLYPKDSYERDSGFTVFTWGIMVGAALAPISCGYLGQTYGWGYGFGLAGIGMLFGLVIFLYGQRYLIGIAEAPNSTRLHRKLLGIITVEYVIYLGTGLVVLFIWQTVQYASLVGYLLSSQLTLVTIGIIGFAIWRLEKKERDRTFAALLVFLVTALFAIFIKQYGSSLLLFSERVVNKEVLGIEIRSSQLVGLLPAFLMLLAPFFAWLWGYLDRNHINPGSFHKFGIAFVFQALAYAVIWFATRGEVGDEQVGLIWLVMMFLLFAISDMWIIPIGMSAVSKLSTNNMIGLMMGAYMLALSAGYYGAALVAQFSVVSPEATNQELTSHYNLFFGYLSVSAAIVGLGLILCAPLLGKLLHGVR